MRTLKLALAYDGTHYAGWQIQRNAKRPTIQGVLQQALRRILQEPVRVIGSGRTDAGVHALAQVAHLRTRSHRSCEQLQRALYGVLPPDIVVTKVEDAPETFHAQFDAKTKRYRYQIVTRTAVLPFERQYVHHVRASLDVPLMRREAKVLLGRHDLGAFQKAGSSVTDTRRTITDLVIHRRNAHVTIEIEANGFLYAMVRRMVGTLLDLGRGYRPPGTMIRILRTQDSHLVGPTAPARGLSLVQVTYRR